MRYPRREVEDSLHWLHILLDDHQGPVYTIVRHVSRSGLSRVITPLIVRGTDDVRYLGYHAARVLGLSMDHDQGVKVTGAGMDMCWHLVYSLSDALYRGIPNDGSGSGGYRLTQRGL